MEYQGLEGGNQQLGACPQDQGPHCTCSPDSGFAACVSCCHCFDFVLVLLLGN